MVTVKEFKEWLENFPEDAEVQVAIQKEPTGYDGHGKVYFEEPELVKPLAGMGCGKGWNYSDHRQNIFIEADPQHPCHGRKILEIGEES